jgi:nucleoside-diphosphate kinase
MHQQTLALIKPDATENKNFIEILEMYKKRLPQLEIVEAKIISWNEEFAKLFYQEHEGTFYFKDLIWQMTSGPIIALLLQGENAIEQVRKLNGATNPAKAEPGSIRFRYGTPDGGPKNAVHSSANEADATREIALVFP